MRPKRQDGNGDSAVAEGNAPRRGLLKERAYAEIKQKILEGTFEPNSFLAERPVAHQLGMSKTPVRAAFQRLEQEGLVTISPQLGIVVRDLSIHEIADLYEMREALETYVVRTLAGRLTPAQMDRVQANLKVQETVCVSGHPAGALASDMEFHLLFCEFLGNQEILRTMGQLRDKVLRVIARVLQLNPGRIHGNYAEHRAIAEAVLRGEGDLAAQRLTEHLEHGKQFLLSPHRNSGAEGSG